MVMGDAQGVVAADRHEGVEAELLEVLADRGDVGRGVLEWVGPRRPEDRAPSGDDPVGLEDVEVPAHPFDQASPTFDDADAGPAVIVDALDDRPDDRIEARAIAPTGQQTDFHDVFLGRTRGELAPLPSPMPGLCSRGDSGPQT